MNPACESLKVYDLYDYVDKRAKFGGMFHMFWFPFLFGNEVIKPKSKLRGDNSSNNAYNHLLLSPPPLVPYRKKKLMEF